MATPLHLLKAMKVLLCLFTLIALFAGEALSAPLATATPVRLLVSLGEMGPDKNMEWRREACNEIYEMGKQIIPGGVQVTCRLFDPHHAIDTYLQQLKKDNTYHVRLLRGFKGSLRLSITNWERNLESDFGTIGWSIGREPHTAPRRIEGIKAIFANFLTFVRDEEAIKSQWLLSARNHSEIISYDFKELSFKSVKDRKKISVDQAASLFEKENAANAKYLRTRMEMALLFSVALPADANILKPDLALETTLIKAARQARAQSEMWRDVVRADDRSVSDLTSYLIENDDTDASDWQNLSGLLGLDAARSFEIPAQIEDSTMSARTATAPYAAKTNSKKSTARLIYLF